MSEIVGVKDPLKKLPALAQRLGVKEWTDSGQGTVILHTGGGQEYCLFELISAFLDRVDAATQTKNKKES